jgi:hypothetical protein
MDTARRDRLIARINDHRLTVVENASPKSDKVSHEPKSKPLSADGMQNKYSRVISTEMDSAGNPKPPLLKQGKSDLVCFRWIHEGTRGHFCSIKGCYRLHKFAPLESPAAIAA